MRLVITVVCAPFLWVIVLNVEKLAEKRGWDTTLSDAVDSVPSAVSFHETLWFTLFSVLLVGFVIGIWVDWFVRKITQRKSRVAEGLGAECRSLAGSIRTLLGNNLAIPSDFPLTKFDGEIDILRIRLKKLKFDVPTTAKFTFINPDNYSRTHLEFLHQYLDCIGAYLKEGMISEAKKNGDLMLSFLDEDLQAKIVEADRVKTLNHENSESVGRFAVLETRWIRAVRDHDIFL